MHAKFRWQMSVVLGKTTMFLTQTCEIVICGTREGIYDNIVGVALTLDTVTIYILEISDTCVVTP